jgi:hypothetical protein
LTASSALTVSGKLTASSALAASSGLTVDGTTTLNDELIVEKAPTFKTSIGIKMPSTYTKGSTPSSVIERTIRFEDVNGTGSSANRIAMIYSNISTTKDSSLSLRAYDAT